MISRDRTSFLKPHECKLETTYVTVKFHKNDTSYGVSTQGCNTAEENLLICLTQKNITEIILMGINDANRYFYVVNSFPRIYNKIGFKFKT